MRIDEDSQMIIISYLLCIDDARMMCTYVIGDFLSDDLWDIIIMYVSKMGSRIKKHEFLHALIYM